MMSDTSMLHARSRSTNGVRSTMHMPMYHGDKSLTGHKSFYRTHIRGCRWTPLMYCILFAMATFLIYYLAYWKDADGSGGQKEEHGDIRINNNDGGGLNKEVVIDDRYHGDRAKEDGHAQDHNLGESRVIADVIDPGDVHDGFDADALDAFNDEGLINMDDDMGDKMVIEDDTDAHEDDVDDHGDSNMSHEADEEEGEYEEEEEPSSDQKHIDALKPKEANGKKYSDNVNKPHQDDDHMKLGHQLLQEPNDHTDPDHKLRMQHDLDVDPDYLAVVAHNQDPNAKPKLPKYKPEKHIHQDGINDAVALKRRPEPKKFPVKLLHEPQARRCPKRPSVLIIVLSTVRDSIARDTIRKTWGSHNTFHAPHIPQSTLDWWTIFAIGADEAPDDVATENARHGDIIQGDFFDLDAEETRKVMMGMKWLRDLRETHPDCRPTYVLKTSSKVFVNVNMLTDWIKTTLRRANNVYAGKVLRQDTPIRDPNDLHFVPYADFPGDHFPDFVRGPTLFMSTDVVIRMVPHFADVTPIAMDDSYIGLLAAKLRLKPHKDERFVHLKRPSNVCHYKSMMLVYNLSPVEHQHIFNVIVGKAGRHCLNDL